MEKIINVYCDESCHLANDQQKAMVLGALWCHRARVAEHHRAIAALKAKHKLSPFFEVKWTKIAPGKVEFYRELVEYFFTQPAMGFRAWVIPDKSILRHDVHDQTHDDWYYKMYFYLLRNLIWTDHKYNVYIDLKDTRSRKKIEQLHKVLSNANYDFSREVVQNIQHVHSHDVGLLQLADVLIGAVSYNARGLTGSAGKEGIVELIRAKTGLSLQRNTLPSDKKFNLCIWRPESGGFTNV